MTEQLKACRACGADCRVERFEGGAIEGVMTVYFCSNSTKFGGDCPDPHAYLNINAWNTRPSPEADAVEAAWRALRQLEIGLSNDALDTLRAALARTPAQEGE